MENINSLSLDWKTDNMQKWKSLLIFLKGTVYFFMITFFFNL